ncbi:assimilatory nitrite reductase small subunit [mine drainage metagenome]|uniref:Assimilatory nitrite reductase small subunit n=1 Tax=mine drainage metagenome TaxID=410659 RepID=A0A1J5QC50_9ZZZZ
MSKQWIEVGSIEDIPALGARVIKTGQGQIAVFKALDGSIFALHNRCPHRQGPLSDGIVHGHKVTCPLHNWVIDLENGKADAPDNGCAPTVPLKVEEGVIFLKM